MANISKPGSERSGDHPRENLGTLKNHISFPVYYEDTDFSGFVYHANYLKYFERAREHLIGIAYLKELFTTGLHFVVARMDVRFLQPARHGDEIAIVSECHFSKSPVLEFRQRAFLSPMRESQRPLVDGDLQIVLLNQSNRPTRLPDSLLQYFANRSFDKTENI